MPSFFWGHQNFANVDNQIAAQRPPAPERSMGRGATAAPCARSTFVPPARLVALLSGQLKWSTEPNSAESWFRCNLRNLCLTQSSA